MERLHHVPKGLGSVIKNLDTFEKSVLVRCIAHQRIHLEQFDERTRLLGKRYDVDGFTLSNAVYVRGLTVTTSDVVLLQTNVLAVVEACGMDTHEELFLMCTICDRIADRRGAAIARRQTTKQQVLLCDNMVQDVKCWRDLDNGTIEVLLPLA